MSNEILSVLSIIVPIFTALISGLISYALAVKKAKKDLENIQVQHQQDIEKLEKQHTLDLETLSEQHKNEMEKIFSQYQHESNMKEKDNVEQLGMGMVSALFKPITENETFKKLIDKKLKEKLDAEKGDKNNGD